MKIEEFFSKYAKESDCRAFFKEQRESAGLHCPRCGSLKHYWIEKEDRWRCKECKQGMGLKQGTVMENSNLSYRVWLWGLYLMSLTKKGFSCKELQRLTGHKRYEPIWLMAQKIRISMGNRDEQYKLDGFIEMDEGFFEGHRKKENPDSIVSKPVKELDRQVKAIVAVSTAIVAVSTKPAGEALQNSCRPDRRAGYVKINVVNSLCNREVSCAAKGMIQKSATVMTDGRYCYMGLQNICSRHAAIIVKDKTQVSKIFPWVHIAISNAKKKILGLHHQVKDAYMQNYLSEFCYKFNRRFFGDKLFDRLLVATLNAPWYQSNSNYG
jgi:transposase-like protein